MKVIKAPRLATDDRTEQQRRERAELVRWVLEFTRRDFEEFEASDWTQLQREADHLTWKLVGSGTVFPVTWLKELERKGRGKSVTVRHDGWVVESRGQDLTFLDERQDESKFRAHLPRRTRDQMRNFQARLRRVLEELRPSDPQVDPAWQLIRYPSIPGAIKNVYLMNDLRSDSVSGFKRVYGADWRHLRWLAIASLLEEFGEHVVRCDAPDCAHLFLRTRRQQYCSRKCSQRVRSASWYKEHQETAKQKRRQAYRERRDRRIKAPEHQ